MIITPLERRCFVVFEVVTGGSMTGMRKLVGLVLVGVLGIFPTMVSAEDTKINIPDSKEGYITNLYPWTLIDQTYDGISVRTLKKFHDETGVKIKMLLFCPWQKEWNHKTLVNKIWKKWFKAKTIDDKSILFVVASKSSGVGVVKIGYRIGKNVSGVRKEGNEKKWEEGRDKESTVEYIQNNPKVFFEGITAYFNEKPNRELIHEARRYRRVLREFKQVMKNRKDPDFQSRYKSYLSQGVILSNVATRIARKEGLLPLCQDLVNKRLSSTMDIPCHGFIDAGVNFKSKKSEGPLMPFRYIKNKDYFP